MGRYYCLSKKLTEEQSQEIQKEIREIIDVKSVEISENHTRMKVITKDNQFSEVMSRVVNICSRVADGTEIKFDGFVYE